MAELRPKRANFAEGNNRTAFELNELSSRHAKARPRIGSLNQGSECDNLARNAQGRGTRSPDYVTAGCGAPAFAFFPAVTAGFTGTRKLRHR